MLYTVILDCYKALSRAAILIKKSLNVFVAPLTINRAFFFHCQGVLAELGSPRMSFNFTVMLHTLKNQMRFK